MLTSVFNNDPHYCYNFRIQTNFRTFPIQILLVSCDYIHGMLRSCFDDFDTLCGIGVIIAFKLIGPPPPEH